MSQRSKRRFAQVLVSKSYHNKLCAECPRIKNLGQKYPCVECAWEAAEYADRSSGNYAATPLWMQRGLEDWNISTLSTKDYRRQRREWLNGMKD
jgi:hypothetical protein